MHPHTHFAPEARAAERLQVRSLGRRSYDDARALQERAAVEVAAGAADRLLFMSHPPLITLGRGATPEQLLVDPEALAIAGVTLTAADRGGGATYHGPGQLVGYPIIDLRRRRVSVRGYLRALEDALVSVLRERRIAAFVRAGMTGVWTDAGKVAAIGIGVRRGISRHGFALNVATEPEAFAPIRPCGLDEPVTSMRRLGWRGAGAGLPGALAAALTAALDAASRGRIREGLPAGAATAPRSRQRRASAAAPPSPAPSVRRAVA